MELFFRQMGAGPDLIILHGLFGSSDNWLTQAKMLSDTFRVWIVDQRNHGRSPHSHEHNYDLLADDIKKFIESNGITNPIVLGHSMGGKAAMAFALKYPELLSALIVVDIAPKNYPVHHDQILEGLKSIKIDKLKTRAEADEALAGYVPEPDVRQFLLKNLQRGQDNRFSWRLNLDALDSNIKVIGEGEPYKGTFEKETLFIRGATSHYVSDEDREIIKRIFPKSNLVTLNTGHWVQAESPDEFVSTVKSFVHEKINL